jgi:hypothetical protein
MSDYIYPPLMVHSDDMRRFRHFAIEHNHADSAVTFRALLDLADQNRLEAADELAAGVESFLKSLPYLAPEAIDFHVQVRLREPLEAFREVQSKPVIP